MIKKNLSAFEWSYLSQLISIADATVLLTQDESELIKCENDLPYELGDLKARIQGFQDTGELDVEKIRTNITSVLYSMNECFKV